MTKKSNPKKKVGIKLMDNQSFFVEDLDVFLHIQKTYVNLANSQMQEQNKEIILRTLAAVQHAIETVFVAEADGYDDKW